MSRARKVAVYGILIALTLALSYCERLIPFTSALPGVKLGLANIAVLIALYSLGNSAAVVVSLIRAVMTGLMFSGVTALFYSFAGAALSVTAMMLVKRCGWFGTVGVSVCGAVSHIVGQVLVSRLMLGGWAVLAYLPLLLGASIVTGVFNGLASGLVLRYGKLTGEG